IKILFLFLSITFFDFLSHIAIMDINAIKLIIPELIAVCTKPGHEYNLSKILFEESTTSGVRLNRCFRYILPRSNGMVPTNWGNVRAKLITRPDGQSIISPEYEACKEVARRFNVPLSKVYQSVNQISVENFTYEEGSVVPKDSTGNS
ncbi:MAG: nickel insertion protein, partial [Dissulfuribacterales bacterium]